MAADATNIFGQLRAADTIAENGVVDHPGKYDAHADIADHLIAAAPKLLAACKDAMSAFEDVYDGAPDANCSWMVEPMRSLEAAIADAEGTP